MPVTSARPRPTFSRLRRFRRNPARRSVTSGHRRSGERVERTADCGRRPASEKQKGEKRINYGTGDHRTRLTTSSNHRSWIKSNPYPTRLSRVVSYDPDENVNVNKYLHITPRALRSAQRSDLRTDSSPYDSPRAASDRVPVPRRARLQLEHENTSRLSTVCVYRESRYREPGPVEQHSESTHSCATWRTSSL